MHGLQAVRLADGRKDYLTTCSIQLAFTQVQLFQLSCSSYEIRELSQGHLSTQVIGAHVEFLHGLQVV